MDVSVAGILTLEAIAVKLKLANPVRCLVSSMEKYVGGRVC